MPDIVRQQGGVQLPSATVGGSTSESANLTDQDGAVAVSLSAASETTLGGVTRQWTVYSPDGTDETSNIITANDDTASPTWAAFTSSSSRVGGIWRIEYALTDDNGTKTYKRYVQVGRLMFGGWAYLAEHTDWTAVTQTLSDGVGYTPNSIEYTPAIPSGCTMIASGDADGLDVDNTGAASSARITAPLAGLGSNSTRIAIVWRAQLYSVSSGGSFSGCGIEDADNSHKTQAWRDKSGADWLAATLQRVASSNASPTATNIGTTECEWQMAVLENGAKEAANLYSTSNTDAMPDIGDFTEYQRYPMVASAFDATGFSRSTDVGLWAIATAEGGKILDTMVWVWS